MPLKWSGTDSVHVRAPIPPHATASKVVRGEGTHNKKAPRVMVMASGFVFFRPKGQKPSFNFIYLRRFYWLALHFYTSSKMATNTLFGTFDPVSLEN